MSFLLLQAAKDSVLILCLMYCLPRMVIRVECADCMLNYPLLMINMVGIKNSEDVKFSYVSDLN
ncbi:hypothetical protein CS542_07275 [Pedobacter sp. IW39]|nr:hypothetical protein CS542_07275 [Pedobacter sp. IW39]